MSCNVIGFLTLVANRELISTTVANTRARVNLPVGHNKAHELDGETWVS
jgi:hypothetical protein